jgi:hypothetical protein
VIIANLDRQLHICLVLARAAPGMLNFLQIAENEYPPLIVANKMTWQGRSAPSYLTTLKPQWFTPPSSRLNDELRRVWRETGVRWPRALEPAAQRHRARPSRAPRQPGHGERSPYHPARQMFSGIKADTPDWCLALYGIQPELDAIFLSRIRSTAPVQRLHSLTRAWLRRSPRWNQARSIRNGNALRIQAGKMCLISNELH